MSAFFVGQRVRIKNADTPFEYLVGAETRIIAPAPDSYDSSDWLLEVVAWGQNVGAASENLEPILPEGHCPAELTVEELLPFLRERAQA